MSATEDPSLNHTASSLVGVVKDHPGIHFRELARAANISSMGQLRHHVDRLRQRGVLIEVQDGRYKRFFVTGTHPPAVRKTLARFSRPVPQRIAKLLLWRPMTRAELRRNLGCADSTLGYHLTRMSIHGDVVKTSNSNHSRYTLADPEAVRAALVMQQSRSWTGDNDGTALPTGSERIDDGSRTEPVAPSMAPSVPRGGDARYGPTTPEGTSSAPMSGPVPDPGRSSDLEDAAKRILPNPTRPVVRLQRRSSSGEASTYLMRGGVLLHQRVAQAE